MFGFIKNLFTGGENKGNEDHHRSQINNLKDFNLQAQDLILNPQRTSISDEYDIQDTTLGHGAFAEVRIGLDKITHQKYAIKIIDKSKMSKEEQELTISELRILSSLDHPHVLKIHKFYNEKNFLYIVTELLTGGELFDQICKEGKFSEKKAATILKQIMQAINYCHKNGIAHRDIKPENILLQSEEIQTLKIIDVKTSSNLATLMVFLT